MILCRTPFRVSFFGGGTDYPVWYRERGGKVLSTAIDQYGYVMVKYLLPLHDYRYEFRYAITEHLDDRYATDHPSIRETLRFMYMKYGFDPRRLTVIYNADVPAMSGLGSSSSFTVGLVNALHALQGRIVGPGQLANEAIEIEQEWIKESVGSQDQVIAAYGGLRIIEFHDRGYIPTPLFLPDESRKALEDYFFLVFTRFQRKASDVARKQIEETPNRVKELETIAAMTEEAIALFGRHPIDVRAVGRLLEESWKVKKSLTNLITTPEIDSIYDYLKSRGMIGGKVTGAGSGGFILACVDPDRITDFKKATRHMAMIPLRLSTSGSRILAYKAPEGDG